MTSALAMRRRAMGKPAAFTPASIGGLKLWLKADGTLFQDSARTVATAVDGDVVGSWTDGSSTAKHAAQATALKKPLYKTAIFGTLPAVRFDAVDDCLQAAALDLSATDKVTVFIVIKNELSGVRVLTELTATYANAGAFLIYNNNDLHTGLGPGECDVRYAPLVGAASRTIVAQLDRAQVAQLDEHKAYVNGGTPATQIELVVGGTVTGNFANDTLNIGSRNNGAAFPCGADMGEFIVYDSILTAAQLNDVGKYLERWGTTWTNVT